HQSACKRFGTVLGPDYNSAHANHFHFDMAQSMNDGSAYCR
ncbi:MAG: extensin family protein, partial [Sphingorhabdus sp.]|nr:extensin family protein [Sphingorhabdus sp.]